MEIAIREARPSDAGQLIAYIKRLSEEPISNIELSPGEFTLTIEEEQEILKNCALSENCVYLVAEIEGRIIGTLNCSGSHRRAIRHSVTLGMSVDEEWRGKGVGSLLMERVIEWAKSTHLVSRIELLVFVRNKVAIHLYQKFGFVVEGCQKKAIFRDGEYLDNLMMALLL